MQYLIKEADRNKRLDIYIHNLDIGLSRSQAQKLIVNEDILVNGKLSNPNYRLKVDDTVDISIPKPKELNALPENIPLEIVYEDPDIVVVNKSRGMVVHPAAGNYSHTLVNALLYHCKDLSGIGGVLRPGIVHRLDKDTSGLIVVAKNDKAHESLSKQFKNHTVNKVYMALVKGNLKNDQGNVNESIGRHPVQRKKMAVVKLDPRSQSAKSRNVKAREAYTEYEVVKRFKEYNLLRIVIKTGRTHQIRVHLSHIGHPVVGDPVYGKGPSTTLGVNSGVGKGEVGGQLLHAQTLGFIHPATGKHVEFAATLPADMEQAISQLEKLRD